MGGKLRKTPDTYYVIYSVYIFIRFVVNLGHANQIISLMPFSNSIKYILCFNSEAKGLIQDSIDTLIKSKSSDFMVFKVMDDKVKNLSGYDEWSESIEIDEDTYKKLHLNLCKKIGDVVRKRAKG